MRNLALVGIALLAVGCSNGPAVVTSSPASSEPSATLPSPTPTALISPTVAPAIESPSPAPISETPAPTSDSPATTPGATPKPQVTSLKAPPTASCTATNGTDTEGYIHLSWTSSGTPGVRLSIDPPSPATAYDYPYADYPATGSADVPFACDPSNHDANGDYHLYVLTTIHASGYYSYRYAKVYQAN